MHEFDPSKGGATLDEMRADCASKARSLTRQAPRLQDGSEALCDEYIFGGRWPIIAFHRVEAFQILTFVMLQAMPSGNSSWCLSVSDLLKHGASKSEPRANIPTTGVKVTQLGNALYLPGEMPGSCGCPAQT